MKYAADFRSIARDALRGKWMIAVLAGLIALLLGGLGADGPEVKLDIDLSKANINLAYGDYTIFSTVDGLNAELGAWIVGGIGYIALVAIVLTIVFFILGSIVAIGYAAFNLDLVDGRRGRIETLFAYFSHGKTAVAARLLQSIYILLWTFLLIIPGIVAMYSYAMTDYILAEYPELSADEAITRSKQMMQGNRFRLFCLQLSFIGWDILCAFTFDIGDLWLRPYKRAATAAFYREISAS